MNTWSHPNVGPLQRHHSLPSSSTIQVLIGICLILSSRQPGAWHVWAGQDLVFWNSRSAHMQCRKMAVEEAYYWHIMAYYCMTNNNNYSHQDPQLQIIKIPLLNLTEEKFNNIQKFLASPVRIKGSSSVVILPGIKSKLHHPGKDNHYHYSFHISVHISDCGFETPPPATAASESWVCLPLGSLRGFHPDLLAALLTSRLNLCKGESNQQG